MDQQKMEQKIAAYINAAFQWHATGNGSLIEGIGRTMEDLEEDILIAFGLPHLAFQYSEILQLEGFSTKNIKARASRLFKVLAKEATQFLLSPIEKDVTILQQSKVKLQDGAEVLPMIGLSTTQYNLFLYYDFYFRNLLNEQELLQHLKEAETMDKQVETRIPFTYQTLQNCNHTKKLMQAGIPFMKEYQQYLKYCSTNQKWDKGIRRNEEETNALLNDSFELSRFFITYMAAKNKDTAVIEILVNINNSFARLRIWCTAEMVQLILLHARYYSLAIPPMYVINSRYFNEREMHLRLKDAIHKNIEIDNIVIGVEREENARNGIPYYSVDYIKTTAVMPAKLGTGLIDELPF